MAAASLRRLIRAVARALAVLALLLLTYPVAGWFGSSIPRGSGEDHAPEEITIMVESNGTHTGVVVPVANEVKDWRDTFPSAARPRLADGHAPTHLGIGWGEKEVFLKVATWDQLTAATALRIATRGGEPLMRVSHYVNPRSGWNYRPVRISTAQYRALVSAIEASLPPLAPGDFREEIRGTYSADSYYQATGHYTLAYTCNVWVSDVLAAAGLEMGLWTPFAGGVSKWVRPPREV